ncbi:GNAT family N-acetyltransferase [Chitinophaga oryzae]|uniref:GNAT family N-acetyltransferase n=1 Tax=Chitinophaga oryzae TaxID=2725414 RepID=A0ABX6LE16_9BACT|nr:GNAT family N-acetyltransferase [Chitinophaga oryzae]QJB38271.1 GNAT family N-acetyltransferase [Chitinophaga oryzae]
MEIINSTVTDIDDIFYLYDEGTKYQRQQGTNLYWKGFERSVVEQEIEQKRQWKLVVDNKTVCVFVTTFSDPLIWGEKDETPSLYLHRIATHPEYRGRGFVKQIVDWAKQYGRENGRQYLRLDTGAGNEKLNNYYVSCGFTYLGVVSIPDPEGLPAHYRDGGFATFELVL